ncbi:unnamed protein product [Ectocarpus fasciculatus]
MARPQCFVVGGGVVGLAVARALSRSLDVILLEAHAAIGSQTSSRNSEVIHSGIYYAPGTLKAELTAPGCEALYTYLASRGVEHKRCGKIIVATNEPEGQEVERLLRVGEKNGVKGLHELSAADLTALEPQLSGHRGLLVPSTGIVDSHGLMLALQADAEDNGAVVVTRCSVQGAIVTDTVGSTGRRGISLLTSQGRFDADVVVNCAGHMAPSVAARIAGHPLHRAPQPYYCKGTYFKLQGVRSPFQRLVYPVPSQHGLGVHATIDLGGAVKFGPDTEWVEPTGVVDGDYTVNPARADSFYSEIRKYWKDLPDGALVPDYSGIRPKLVGPAGGEGDSGLTRNLADFLIEGPRCHGVSGLVNMYGIESPGLTASLAIADRVARIIESEY